MPKRHSSRSSRGSSRLRVKPLPRRKPRIEPPGTIPRKGDKIVKVRRCVRGRFYSTPIGTRATVVNVVSDLWKHDEGVWTDKQIKNGATVCPCIREFAADGGWRVCRRVKRKKVSRRANVGGAA